MLALAVCQHGRKLVWISLGAGGRLGRLACRGPVVCVACVFFYLYLCRDCRVRTSSMLWCCRSVIAVLCHGDRVSGRRWTTIEIRTVGVRRNLVCEGRASKAAQGRRGGGRVSFCGKLTKLVEKVMRDFLRWFLCVLRVVEVVFRVYVCGMVCVWWPFGPLYGVR